MKKAFQLMLDNWEKMKRSHEEDAQEDADQFEASFYALFAEVRTWYEGLEEQPKTLDDALKQEEIKQMVEQLPAEILLNFETELEWIIEGEMRVEDEKYD